MTLSSFAAQNSKRYGFSYGAKLHDAIEFCRAKLKKVWI